MPKKPVTWVGLVVILGAGIFCFSGLFRYRSVLPASSTRIPLVTFAAFAAIVVALAASSLWYYFNEK